MRINTDHDVAPPSVREPGSVGAAPACLNGGSRRWVMCRSPNGELFAEDSGTTRGLGIHEDHLREPGLELHETAGITSGGDP